MGACRKAIANELQSKGICVLEPMFIQRKTSDWKNETSATLSPTILVNLHSSSPSIMLNFNPSASVVPSDEPSFTPSRSSSDLPSSSPSELPSALPFQLPSDLPSS